MMRLGTGWFFSTIALLTGAWMFAPRPCGTLMPVWAAAWLTAPLWWPVCWAFGRDLVETAQARRAAAATADLRQAEALKRARR